MATSILTPLQLDAAAGLLQNEGIAVNANLIVAINNYEKRNLPATLYIHSWELTPEFMPRIPLPIKENFITFHNIKKAFSRMDNILKKFEFTSFSQFMKTQKI